MAGSQSCTNMMCSTQIEYPLPISSKCLDHTPSQPKFLAFTLLMLIVNFLCTRFWPSSILSRLIHTVVTREIRDYFLFNFLRVQKSSRKTASHKPATASWHNSTLSKMLPLECHPIVCHIKQQRST